MLAVLGTVGAWYVGDVLYNDYPNNHAQTFTMQILENAWWQVAWFVLVFLLLTPLMHGWMNGSLRPRSSQVYRLLETGAGNPRFQTQFIQLFWSAATVWLVLVVIVFIRLGEEIPNYFFPYLGYVTDPWSRGRLGSGFDSLLSVAGYLQIFVAAMFGLVAALTRNGWVRSLALILCCLTWPNYVFGRTRNALLTVVVPGILAWVFIRLRVGWTQKLAVLAVFFLIIHVWLAFIIANRSNVSITSAARGQGVSLKEVATTQEGHHEGLNMFEELCWINTFMENGSYHPNWGARYFAEIVNPIPRTLWPGKPMIGIDYADARGQSYGAAADTEAGVGATISTGMIGQGVVNFGPVLGTAFAAFLMSLWAAVLARLDLQGYKLGRLPLYSLGLILTFNMGRDITFITLYTFVFGVMVVWYAARHETVRQAHPRRAHPSSKNKRNHRSQAAAGK